MELDSLQIEVPNYGTGNIESQQLPRIWEKKYHNSSKDLVLGFDPQSEDAIARKAVRAKRFGIKKEKEESPVNPFADIQLENIRWPPLPQPANGETRAESLLIYGVHEMSTQDIFSYFKLFGPDTVEWIDDYSCNVVWEFAAAAAVALKATSKTYSEIVALQSATSEGNERVYNDNEKEQEIWRIAAPFVKGDQLFLRQSTTNDRKLPGAAQRSYYYLKYGKSGQEKGLVSSSRKRKIKQLSQTAAERLNPAEPDVKFMELDSEEQRNVSEPEEMEVDNIPCKKFRRLEESLYSDRNQPKDFDVFGRLGRQEQHSTDKDSQEVKRKPVHERLGPKDQNTNAKVDYSEALQQPLDLRNKLKRSKDNVENRKLNLSIEITEVSKNKDNITSRPWKQSRPAPQENENVDDSSGSGSDSDSESESENEEIESTDVLKTNLNKSESSDSEISSGSSSSSSSSDDDSESDDSDSSEEDVKESQGKYKGEKSNRGDYDVRRQ